jgi:hypothetical protein
MYGRMSATYSPRLRELDEMRPMQRLCFLLPDVANERTELGDLPDAGKIEESDFYPQLKRGLALGGAIGVIGGLIAMRAAGAVFGGGAVLLFGLIGAGVNALLAATAGASFPNSRLTQFEKAIETGHVLVMVNVPSGEVAAIEQLVESRHPEVEVETLEPHTPAFPHR